MPRNALELELGPANAYVFVKPQATLDKEAGATANTKLRYRAILPGASGNDIDVEYVVPAVASSPLSVDVTGLGTPATPFLITVNIETVVASTGVSTANEVRDAVNADPTASSIVTVTLGPSSNGTGVVAASDAAESLTGGSDTGVETDLGFLGEDMAVTIAAEANPLTAAQTGTIALDKVVIGGTFRFTLPLKQINLENYARAFPNTLLFTDPDGTQRVEFRSKVGQSLRRIATKLVIKKIIGTAESANPKDHLVVLEATPADVEGEITFSPTDQRVILANFEAWPQNDGRWAFLGSEIL